MLTNQYDESPRLEQVQPAYQPSQDDQTEAAQLFGELADDLDVAEFEAWLEGLHHERFRSITRAIEVLRSALIDYWAEANTPEPEDGSAAPTAYGSLAGHDSQWDLYNL